MTECIFCKIIAGEIPSYKVYEDDHTLAFLDIYGATDGHTMVIPKKHGETILHIEPSELVHVWTAVRLVASAIEKTYDTKILSIGINHGEPQGVRHLHIHILPRYEGDGGGIIQSLPGRPLRNKDFSSVAENIRKNLK